MDPLVAYPGTTVYRDEDDFIRASVRSPRRVSGAEDPNGPESTSDKVSGWSHIAEVREKQQHRRSRKRNDATGGTKLHDHNGGHGDDGRRRPFTKRRGEGESVRPAKYSRRTKNTEERSGGEPRTERFLVSSSLGQSSRFADPTETALRRGRG